MCFSAPVSFLASGALTTLGVSSFFRAFSKNLKILSLAPIVFGIQQAMEGFQWLALKSGHPNIAAAYVFLFFAFPFWLVYVPLVVLLNEKHPKRIQWLFFSLGIVTSLFYFWVLLFNYVSVEIVGQSIQYLMATSHSIIPSLFYILVVCGSLVTFKEKSVRWFGFLVLLSAVISQFFYTTAFTSVWCFFAAILSLFTYFYIRSKTQESKNA